VPQDRTQEVSTDQYKKTKKIITTTRIYVVCGITYIVFYLFSTEMSTISINSAGANLMKVQQRFDRLHDRQSLALGFIGGGAIGIVYPHRALSAALLCTGVSWFILRPLINQQIEEFAGFKTKTMEKLTNGELTRDTRVGGDLK